MPEQEITLKVYCPKLDTPQLEQGRVPDWWRVKAHCASALLPWHNARELSELLKDQKVAHMICLKKSRPDKGFADVITYAGQVTTVQVGYPLTYGASPQDGTMLDTMVTGLCPALAIHKFLADPVWRNVSYSDFLEVVIGLWENDTVLGKKRGSLTRRATLSQTVQDLVERDRNEGKPPFFRRYIQGDGKRIRECNLPQRNGQCVKLLWYHDCVFARDIADAAIGRLVARDFLSKKFGTNAFYPILLRWNNYVPVEETLDRGDLVYWRPTEFNYLDTLPIGIAITRNPEYYPEVPRIRVV